MCVRETRSRWKPNRDIVRILNKQGEFLAVAAVESGWVRPRVVLTSTTSDLMLALCQLDIRATEDWND